MYAVIVTDGKQHKVTEQRFLRVEKLDVAASEAIDFDTSTGCQWRTVNHCRSSKVELPVSKPSMSPHAVVVVAP